MATAGEQSQHEEAVPPGEAAAASPGRPNAPETGSLAAPQQAVPDLRPSVDGQRCQEASPAPARRSVSIHPDGSGYRAYTPTLWQAQQRDRASQSPKPVRDSLRSRSNEGRPGSRKHRRWTHSVDVAVRLRRLLFAAGEEADEAELARVALLEHRPSPFYRLLEHEGPKGALEALNSAEAARRAPRPRSRPRRRTAAQAEEEEQRAVRNGFGDNYQYVKGSQEAKALLAKLEAMVIRTFGHCARPDSEADGSDADEPGELLFEWDGSDLQAKSGGAVANEVVIAGLDPAQRKFVHQFARLLGLHSESWAVEDSEAAPSKNLKVLTMRPPRRPCGPGQSWARSLSVTRILAGA